MTDTNITMVKGDTLSFGMEFEGLDQDLSAAYFSCKMDYTDDEYAFQKALNDGITKVSTGKYRVRIAPADTADLDAGLYRYDLQISVNSDVFTLMRGVLDIQEEVTED